jgi:membrane associated rhomboid family serine protease
MLYLLASIAGLLGFGGVAVFAFGAMTTRAPYETGIPYLVLAAALGAVVVPLLIRRIRAGRAPLQYSLTVVTGFIVCMGTGFFILGAASTDPSLRAVSWQAPVAGIVGGILAGLWLRRHRRNRP